ncbi:MAG TPA: glycosyltransferase family A protein [Solirubrobacteraceae bacterium]
MRFSILLPTRDRLEYLRLAVESVMRQDFEDWQLVISDNCSVDDIAGYAESLADPRIVYRRTERPVPVTENWNRALALSEGEYVIMLGDDDALLGGYLRRMDDLIGEFADPEVIYTKALLFTYPGVDPARPAGFLMDHGCAEFYGAGSAPFVLDSERALAVVRAAMDFRLRFDFNAQFALISRRLIEQLGVYGDFYQSDFPDYYSMNAAFLEARRIVVDPSPRVVIGVTPKSYGYYHVNDKESEGRDFLGGSRAPAAIGTNINVGWLSAATALERGVAGAHGLAVNHRRYRFVQAAYVYQRHGAGTAAPGELRRLERELPLPERLAYRASSAALGLVHRALPARLQVAMIGLAHRLVGQLPPVDPEIVEGRYDDVLAVCEERSAPAARAAPGHQG